jgi:hypothetical protein
VHFSKSHEPPGHPEAALQTIQESAKAGQSPPKP